MIFYLDFEATQPENEIIAIGAVAENGSTFHSLVKPQFSSISQFVSDLTHISQEDLEKASIIDVVLKEFDRWVMNQELNIMNCRFVTYGDDKKFLQATLPAIKSSAAFYTGAALLTKIEDCVPDAKNFFKGSIRLVDAYNYVQSMSYQQEHNPLKDAMMLKDVYNYIQNNEPLTAHPLSKTTKAEIVKMPSGTFWCQHINGGKNIRSFDTCDDAIDWFIKTVIKAKEPENVNRNKIMLNIMKAIRKKTTYGNYKWGRVKEENSVKG